MMNASNQGGLRFHVKEGDHNHSFFGGKERKWRIENFGVRPTGMSQPRPSSASTTMMPKRPASAVSSSVVHRWRSSRSQWFTAAQDRPTTTSSSGRVLSANEVPVARDRHMRWFEGILAKAASSKPARRPTTGTSTSASEMPAEFRAVVPPSPRTLGEKRLLGTAAAKGVAAGRVAHPATIEKGCAERAADALRRFQLQECISECENVVARAPFDFRSRWCYGRALTFTNQYDRARWALSGILSSHCGSCDPRFDICGKEYQAIAAELRAVDVVEQYSAAMRRMEYPLALETSSVVCSVFEGTPLSTLCTCMRVAALVHLEPSLARTQILPLCAGEHCYHECWFLLGLSTIHAQCTTKTIEAALAAARRAASLLPRCLRYTALVSSLTALTDVFATYDKMIAERQFAGARTFLSSSPVAEIDSVKAEVLRRQAKAAMLGGDLRIASADVVLCLAYNASDLDALLLRAQIRFQQGDFSGAKEDAVKVLSAHPTDEQAVKVAREIANALRQHGATNSSNAQSSPAPSAAHSPYTVLGVEHNASAHTIRRAFREQALLWHPDRWASHSQNEQKVAEQFFKEVLNAYDVLCNKQRL